MTRWVKAVLALAVTIALSASVSPSAAGSSRDEYVSQLIAKLSWDSVEYDHDQLDFKRWPKPVGLTAQRLIDVGIPATPALLAALRDPDRAAAAQLVLCRIWFPYQMLDDSEARLYRGKEFIGRGYQVYGLTWAKSVDGKSVVDTRSVGPAIEQWCRFLTPQVTAGMCGQTGAPPPPSRGDV